MWDMADHLLRKQVSAEVRSLLGRHDLRQQDLVPALGVNQGQVSKRMKGHIAWSVDDIESLAEFFGVPVETFLQSAWSRGRDELDARLRHPTGLASLAAELDALQDPRETAANGDGRGVLVA